MTAELLTIAAASAAGSALAVWGIVRHELRAMRDDIRAVSADAARAHRRIDAQPCRAWGGE